jgi:hypothetical protein
MKEKLNNLRIGYVSHSPDFSSSTDRRRFVHYSKNRGINFEIAHPEKEYDIVFVTHGSSDLTVWSKYDKSNALVVYDLIDSYLAIPVLSFFGLFRGVVKYISGQHKYCVFNYKKSVELMCRRADVVICSTIEQKDSIEQYCDNVHIILDVKTMYDNHKKFDQSQSAKSVLNIAWEGLPHNIKSFTVIREALSILSKHYEIHLHLITALKFKQYMNKYITKYTVNEVKKHTNTNNVHLYDWNELTVSLISSACDFAVIPINSKDPMDNGKPEDKLLNFWLMGLPTVVSETPAHLRAMNAAGLSTSCLSTNDWVSAIRGIADNKINRKQVSKKGFIYATQVNSEEKIMSLWDNMFSSIVDMKIKEAS